MVDYISKHLEDEGGPALWPIRQVLVIELFAGEIDSIRTIDSIIGPLESFEVPLGVPTTYWRVHDEYS